MRDLNFTLELREFSSTHMFSLYKKNVKLLSGQEKIQNIFRFRIVNYAKEDVKIVNMM